MTPDSSLSFDREKRLQEVLVACVEASEKGEAVDREALRVRYPEFAAELDEFFADRQRMAKLAEPLREAVAPGPDPAPPDPEQTPTLAPREPSASPAQGTTIRYLGDYELLEEIGRGGMGVIYKACQVSLKRIVAVKMILTGQLAGQDDLRRFQAEAEAAARLDHPGIVPVYEVGQHQGHHYFSMAYVESESLARKLLQGLPSPREAAQLTRKIALAVAFAHLEGVIHRDLKPANILIDRHGEPRITDFGLSRRLRAAVVNPGGTLRIWDTTTGKLVAQLEGHKKFQVYGLAFSPDGLRLASEGVDQTVRLWDLAGGREIRRFDGHTAPATTVAFTSDGARLASGDTAGTVIVWDTASGTKTLGLQAQAGIGSLAFRPDSQVLATATFSGAVKLWDATPVGAGEEEPPRSPVPGR